MILSNFDTLPPASLPKSENKCMRKVNLTKKRHIFLNLAFLFLLVFPFSNPSQIKGTGNYRKEKQAAAEVVPSSSSVEVED